MIERLIELISFLRSNQNSNTMIERATSKQLKRQMSEIDQGQASTEADDI